MGFYFVVGPCLVCHQPFSYNPDRVPSHPARGGVPVADTTAPKEPICQTCIGVINEQRAANGQPTWTVHPDAYEPAEGLPG